jgi:hypothetical protein
VAGNKTSAPASARNSIATNASEPVTLAKTKTSQSGFVNQNIFAGVAAADADTTATSVKELPTAPTPRTVNLFQAGAMNNPRIFADMPTQNQGTQIVRSTAPVSNPNRFGVVITKLGSTVTGAVKKRTTPPLTLDGWAFSAMSGSGLKPSTTSAEVAAAAPLPEKTESELSSSYAFRSRALSAGVNGQMEMYSAQHAWRVSGGKLLKPGDSSSWVEAYPSTEGIEFATFSAHGRDVWAGGNNAALIHSRDGGATWERVTLGATATGTINSIEIRGATVQVKSSSGQSWSSPDSGRTWKIDE